MRTFSAALSIVACTAAALIPAGCAIHPTIHGSGVVATEPREVPSFSSIDLGGFGEVRVEQTGSESVTIEAEDNLLPLLVAEVKGGRLRLGTKPDVNVRATRPVVFRVTVDDLDAVTVSGSGKVRVPHRQTPRLRAGVSGSGDVRIDDLEAERVDGHVSGSGGLRVGRLNASRLDGDISGSGTVHVAGHADEVDLAVSGSGSYHAADLECRQASVRISGSG